MRGLFARTLALEARFYDSMAAGAAQQLEQGSVDVAKLEKLERHEVLLDALDKWIQAPDNRLHSQLAELGQVVRSLYELPEELVVYRGFDRQSRYQNTMGLSERGLLHNAELDIHVGQQHHYVGDTPVSCTTDESIAKAFGECVVRIVVQPFAPGSLVITPELCALICKRRNVEAQTQKEVLLLPPVQTAFHIHAIR